MAGFLMFGFCVNLFTSVGNKNNKNDRCGYSFHHYFYLKLK
jgi:hypothetical protein